MENIEKTYMILDLNDYSVSYLEDVPSGGWTDEYKTKKLVLRYITAGTFLMGSPEDELGRRDDETQHKVTLTKSFYMGIFPVTQKQYELITGDDPSEFKGAMNPVESVSYDMLRGKEKGARWPEHNLVDGDSFFGILRAKAGLEFDLPTEAQWEYACRAGMTTSWNNGTNLTNIKKDPELDKLGRYCFNNNNCAKSGLPTGESISHSVVGSYLPNAWGLYDMHGNVWEWCLDWYDKYPNDEVRDYKGVENGYYRVLRGGCWNNYLAIHCRSAGRHCGGPRGDGSVYGIRVALASGIQNASRLKRRNR